ncbi:MAG: SPOR domain-containing protein [Phenylobacterium sp.]
MTTDIDRGAYTPSTDAPLSFDARQPVRGARPVPFTLIASAVVLIALVAAIFLFYRGGARQAGDAPPTVGAPVGDLRGAASPESQPQDPAAGLQIYRSDEGQAAAANAPVVFAPPPEQPAPRPVAVEPPPAAAPTTPVATQVVPPAAKPAPVVAAAPPAPAPAPKPVVVAPAPKAAPAPTAKPAPTPAPAPALKAAAPAPKPAPAAVASSGGGSASVQIGAFASRDLAEAELGKVSGVSGNPGGRNVEPAPGTALYRAKVTGFASRDAAVAWCNKLKATGKQCIVRWATSRPSSAARA